MVAFLSSWDRRPGAVYFLILHLGRDLGKVWGRWGIAESEACSERVYERPHSP